MAYIRRDASYLEQGKKSGSVYEASKIGDHTRIFQSRPAVGVPDTPMPIKNPRMSALFDQATIRKVSKEGRLQSHGGKMNLMNDMKELSDKNDGFLHLNRPLLVRLKIPRKADEIRAICDSKDISRAGLKLLLPCMLDLRAGSFLNMELFLRHEEKPISVAGQVREIARYHSEDLLRYEVEVNFDPRNSRALSQIDGFIQTSEAQDYQRLPA